MNVVNAIDAIFQDSTWNKSRVAKELGISPQRLNGRLREGKSPKTNNVIEILNIIGFNLVIVPKGSRLPSGSYVLTDEQDDSRLHDQEQG